MNSLEHLRLDQIAINPDDTFEMPEAKKENIRKLVTASHRSFMDVDGVLPWTEGINLSLYAKDPATSWVYGTPYWDLLNEEQRVEMLWKETARDVSMFIWLEQALPPLYVGWVNKYRGSITPEMYEYLMIFSKEEIVHTLMFRRFLKMARLPLYAMPESPYMSLVQKLPVLHPAIGLLWTVTIEWAAELVAIHGSQADCVEPLTRKMFYEHHLEEVRHITFNRRVVENFFNTASRAEQAAVREQFKPALESLISLLTFNPEIASHLSFKFPADLSDPAIVSSIRNSENNRVINDESFKPQREWFAELGLTA